MTKFRPGDVAQMTEAALLGSRQLRWLRKNMGYDLEGMVVEVWTVPGGDPEKPEDVRYGFVTPDIRYQGRSTQVYPMLEDELEPLPDDRKRSIRSALIENGYRPVLEGADL